MSISNVPGRTNYHQRSLSFLGQSSIRGIDTTVAPRNSCRPPREEGALDQGGHALGQLLSLIST